MGRLLERYWLPMFTHLRVRGVSVEQAEDLIQDFMVEIINRNLLAIADPKKGKLRTLLLTSLDRFAVSQHRRATAAKRSPGKIASLDVVTGSDATADGEQPGHTFDRAWGLDLLCQSLADMRRACADSEAEIRWQVFERRILEPLLDDVPPPPFRHVAEQLGLADEKAAMNRLVTAKRQFARHLREVVRAYVQPNRSPREDDATEAEAAYQLTENVVRQDIEREIEDLRRIMAKSRSAAPIGGEVPHAATQADPIKCQFWHRLTRQHDEGAGNLSGMFHIGTSNSQEGEAPLDVCFNDTLDTELRSFPGLEYCGPGTLRTLVDDRQAPIDLVRRVKDWLNISRLGSDVTLPENVANGLYFLLLAAHVDRKGARITGLEDHDLRTGYQWLLDQAWFVDNYRPLVQRAIDRLA